MAAVCRWQEPLAAYSRSPQQKYLKQFDNKKTKLLFKQKNNYYTINLIKNQKFLFIILYNLFQKKLIELRRYLKNILIKN